MSSVSKAPLPTGVTHVLLLFPKFTVAAAAAAGAGVGGGAGGGAAGVGTGDGGAGAGGDPELVNLPVILARGDTMEEVAFFNCFVRPTERPPPPPTYATSNYVSNSSGSNLKLTRATFEASLGDLNALRNNHEKKKMQWLTAGKCGAGPTLEGALTLFNQWLAKHGCAGDGPHSTVAVTVHGADAIAKLLSSEVDRKGLRGLVSPCLHQVCDLGDVFKSNLHLNKQLPNSSDASHSLDSMLAALHLKPTLPTWSQVGVDVNLSTNERTNKHHAAIRGSV
jgi:hypothetical protein